MKKKKTFTKQDEKHYIIYRYLDKLGISEPYLHATAILQELSKKGTNPNK